MRFSAGRAGESLRQVGATYPRHHGRGVGGQLVPGAMKGDGELFGEQIEPTSHTTQARAATMHALTPARITARQLVLHLQGGNARRICPLRATPSRTSMD